QRPTANDITLDGMTFGSGSVPQDAVRSTRVVTSTYDVARGQFSGGVVASTTRSGTNVPQGSFTFTNRDRDLSWGGVTNSPFSQGYTQNQIGGGFGGPIIPNRLFVFAALQGRFRGQALPSLLSADPATLGRLGVNPDSAAKFIQLAALAGVPINLPGIPDDRSTDNSTGLVRVDWNLSDVQTLMVRVDGRWSSQDPTRIGALALPPTGGTRDEQGGGLMAMLTSYIGGNFINELRGYASTDRNNQNGFLSLPEGRVQVGSTLADSSFGFANLAFGGNPGFPQSSETRGIEASDEFSWLPGNTQHRFKLGLYLNGTQQKALQTPNQLGTFLFPSLGAFANNQPDLYTRTLAPLQQAGTAWNTALYLGDIWRTGPALQIAYGFRLEGASFTGAPAFNPAVDSLFGARTDQIPSEKHFSPRVGFTWMPGAADGFPATIIRGGFGDFRSLTPNTLYSAALAAPGLSNAETQLVCIGSSVPTPDWGQYANNPSSVPSACTDTATAVEITPNPNVTVFAPNYTAPRAWRASLGVQRRILGGTYTVSLDGNYARGMSQYGFRDLNLNTVPQFTLPEEGNRPVYVPEDSVQTATGTLSSLNSRLHSQFGQVIQVGSDLESDSKQVTLGFGGFTARGATFQVSYTYTRALDQSSFSCCAATQGFASATTAGDPNVREWATSDFERRHSFLGTLTYPVSAAIEVTAIGRLNSGTPYTPLVGSDINGDGARNDRAFVFDPATAADPAVAAAMKTLLANAPGARDCLLSQLGQIAARNSCTGPWQTSLDFQVNYRPDWFGLDRRLTLSMLTVNFLGGLDEWIHGSNNLHGWGYAASPDPVLLYVRGFSPGTSSFVYSVNGHFGSRQGANSGVTVPFQIGFQGHFTIGPDP
ncbi:MAG TPA: TonB-dependent receptor, partial [Gemmatimonadales bacterium]|nr:TonB-dependent receptor [Gemmatimonadales bacterium]